MNIFRDEDGELQPSLVYGETVYWLTIAGAVVAVIGSVVAFATDANLLNPVVAFAAIWEGRTAAEIWLSAGGVEPSRHWYLRALPSGDALAMTGIIGAIVSLVPATLAAGWLMLRRRERFYCAVALVAAILILNPLFDFGVGYAGALDLERNIWSGVWLGP
jgi:hypothetical protein